MVFYRKIYWCRLGKIPFRTKYLLLDIYIVHFREVALWLGKQEKTVIVGSSAETKYRAMAHTISELTWLQHFLQEIGFLGPTPIPLYCDNHAAFCEI
jgi:hypothetical protein